MAALFLSVFVLFQGIMFLFAIVIRYHFRLFALPGDSRAQALSRACIWGTTILCLISVIIFAALFVSGTFDAISIPSIDFLKRPL